MIFHSYVDINYASVVLNVRLMFYRVRIACIHLQHYKIASKQTQMHFPRMFLKKIAKMSKSKNIESFPQNGPKNRNQTFESLCSNQYISSSNKVLTALFFPLIHFRVMTLYIICVENLQINMKNMSKIYFNKQVIWQYVN